MKKMLALLLALVTVAALSACQKEEIKGSSNLEEFKQQEITYDTYTDKDTGGVFTFDTLDTTSVVITGYQGPTEMHDVKIPSTVQTGEDAATTTKAVVSIGKEAFKAISSIRSVVIPDGVTTIETYAFADCVQMDSVTVPASVESIGEGAFRNCGLLSFTFPEESRLTEIKLETFSKCFKLKEIVIPSYIKTVGQGAFFECTALEKVVISEGVVTVGKQAFQGTTALARLELPSTLTNTDPTGENGDFAFSGSDVLYRENIICPAGSAAEAYANKMVLSEKPEAAE